MADHPRWTEIKVAMLVHVPFFSSLLFDLMDVRIGKFPNIFGGLPPTAATDGKRIYFDEDFLSKLDLPEAVFVMCHEIGHAMWMHMDRAAKYRDLGFEGEPFDARRWNFAGDYVINDMLVKSGVGNMPKVGLLDAKYKHDMLVEDVYRLLKDEMPPQKKITVCIHGAGDPDGGEGMGDGAQAEADGNAGETIDVHIIAGAEVNDAEMKRAVQTALDCAKAQGKMPAALERFANEFLEAKVSWQERLRYHVTTAIARDATTWSKPRRRWMLSHNLYLPGYTGFGAGDVVVVVDTSGSIGQKELDRFFSELDDILMNCKPTSVTLIGCDARVNSTHYLEAGQDLRTQKIELGGGGGTSFCPPFDWVEKQGHKPSALIYFTDMYGDFPPVPPGYPVVWCRTSNVAPPWGEVIDVEL